MADFQPIETAPKDGTVIGVWSPKSPAVIRVVRWGRHLNGPRQPFGWVIVTTAITASWMPTHWVSLGPLPGSDGVGACPSMEECAHGSPLHCMKNGCRNAGVEDTLKENGNV